MVEIRWSPIATDDYESIIMYYEKTAPKFAQNFAKKIIYIIEDGLLIYSSNKLDLYKFFFIYRKLWDYQKYR